MDKYFNLVKELIKNCKNCDNKFEISSNFYCSAKIDESELDNPHATIHKGIVHIDAVCQNCGYIHSFSKDLLDRKLSSG